MKKGKKYKNWPKKTHPSMVIWFDTWRIFFRFPSLGELNTVYPSIRLRVCGKQESRPCLSSITSNCVQPRNTRLQQPPSGFFSLVLFFYDSHTRRTCKNAVISFSFILTCWSIFSTLRGAREKKGRRRRRRKTSTRFNNIITISYATVGRGRWETGSKRRR